MQSSAEPPALDLAVIIVTWNVRALALDAIRTLQADLASSSLRTETWVVDNASSDGTVDAIRAEFPNVHLIACAENLGFGAGNNLALRALGFCDTPTLNPSGPRAVFLLNSDTQTQPGAVRALCDTLLNTPDAGLIGAQLAYGDGSFQHSAFHLPGPTQIVIDLFPLGWLPRRVFGRLYESRLNGRYPRALYNSGTAFPIGHPLGATMLFRREAIEQSGLFDEQFFMYCEEIDWSMRVHAAGWRVYCQPRARITHLSGQSTRQIRTESLINLWRSRFRLYQKHYSPLKLAVARWLVKCGVRLQMRRASGLPQPERDSLLAAYRTILDL